MTPEDQARARAREYFAANGTQCNLGGDKAL